LLYLRHISSQAGRTLLRCVFTMHMKFIDDFLYGNSGITIDTLQSLYPPWVRFEITTKVMEDGSIVGIFLNLQLHIYLSGDVRYHVFHKTSKLPFEPSQFVHLCSNRADSFCYKIICGQLHCAAILNSSSSFFRTHVSFLINAFLKNGFNKNKLIHTALKFFKQRSYTHLPAFDPYHHIIWLKQRPIL
jgi:hypothetical protein